MGKRDRIEYEKFLEALEDFLESGKHERGN